MQSFEHIWHPVIISGHHEQSIAISRALACNRASAFSSASTPSSRWRARRQSSARPSSCAAETLLSAATRSSTARALGSRRSKATSKLRSWSVGTRSAASSGAAGGAVGGGGAAPHAKDVWPAPPRAPCARRSQRHRVADSKCPRTTCATSPPNAARAQRVRPPSKRPQPPTTTSASGQSSACFFLQTCIFRHRPCAELRGKKTAPEGAALIGRTRPSSAYPSRQAG